MQAERSLQTVISGTSWHKIYGIIVRKTNRSGSLSLDVQLLVQLTSLGGNVAICLMGGKLDQS